MNAFLSILDKYEVKDRDCLTRGKLTTLQVNMGNLCNQNCLHCHVGASPQGNNIMSKKIVDDIIKFLARYKIQTLDITGGAPELNPDFEYFVDKARPLVDELIVRSNLTVLQEEGQKHLPAFFRKHNVHLVCSLPCCSEENVDAQRGSQVFEKSVRSLKALNELGFAEDEGFYLDLVYNPVGAHLPPQQEELEKKYKQELEVKHNIHFNRLITITNVPIKRFKTYLESRGEYEKYCQLLKDNFNPGVLQNIMCRTFLSVGFDGQIYDCDFNQALGYSLKDEEGISLTIDKLAPYALEGREIIIGGHCLSCTAGSGSSCQGALVDTKEIAAEVAKETVKEYYGKILNNTKDLKTNACCSIEVMPSFTRDILKRIEPEIQEKFYGCGFPIPSVLDGCTVLDLGCGTGRDVYLASYLVGEEGSVIGVDMTDEQLAVARKYQNVQMKKFGFQKTNVQFKKGYIEDLGGMDIKDNSIDVVISNCVINLSPDKEIVFSEIFRVLKNGGELFFSDVFADRRVPERIKQDPVFYAECLGGALYIEDLRRILRKSGCLDYRVVSKKKIDLQNPDIQLKAGAIEFYSMTVRAFKLDSLEDICEDYGQVATYLGTIPECPNQFILDDHHVFLTNKPMLVCGNTADMLKCTRYNSHFAVFGDMESHFGPFDCSSSSDSPSSTGGSCC